MKTHVGHEKSILVLENRKGSLSPIVTMLAKNRYKTQTSNHATQAYTQLLQSPKMFSAIILEHPLINVLEFVKKILSNSALTTLPIILHTSDNIEEIEEAIRTGIRYCLPKSFQDPLTLPIIQAAIQDQTRYLQSQDDLDGMKAATFLSKAHFQFKHLKEAQILGSFLSQACPNPRLAVVGLIEIFINAIEHGNLNISYEEKSRLEKENRWMEEVERRIALPENINKIVKVDFERTKQALHIKVIDEGQGFQPDQYQHLDAKRIFHTHGRGIVIAKGLVFSELRYSEKGNEVEGIIPL